MNVSAIGLDLAKNVISVHGVNEHGKVVLRKTVSRAKLMVLLGSQPRCLVGMESCSGAHHYARRLRALGFDARILAPKFVAPYRKGGKNDANDAEAICEAVTRPTMRFVAVKSEEQQAVLSLHRIRQGRIKERTALINQIRGLLQEFGLVIGKGRYTAQKAIPSLLEDGENGLPHLARRLLHEEYLRLLSLNEQILSYDREIERLARQSADARRLQTIPGVGPITAITALAAIGDINQFQSGRQLAAWLGLVPRQYSTGGKPVLGRITKRGDAHLRALFVHGARAAIHTIKDKDDCLSEWVKTLIERRGKKRAIVALAAKNVRLVWALLTSGSDYQTYPALEKA